jgi:hypothetical protein
MLNEKFGPPNYFQRKVSSKKHRELKAFTDRDHFLFPIRHSLTPELELHILISQQL